MLLCTQEPRSATRGYSCARFLIPGFLILICFVILFIHLASRSSSVIKRLVFKAITGG
jgi:hypothetical protein